MKNKLIILVVALMAQLYISQEYPLNTTPSDVPNNAYIKDINGELDKYVGLWKGDWNGKTVYLELKKIKVYNSITGATHAYYSDNILGERKVVNANGVIEIDRIINFNNQTPEFWGIYNSLKYPGNKSIIFYPDNMCGKTATIHRTNFTPTQMTLHLEYDPSFWKEDCIHNAYVDQYDDWPINFPKDIVLTKQ